MWLIIRWFGCATGNRLCPTICRSTELLIFFFFKQKTAYDMRISDWSSDVCSSDLKSDMLDFADFIAINKFDRKGAADALRDVRKQYQRNRDRTSVVSGQSVSVRVDLGGRRIIKQKTTYHTQPTTQF